MIALQSADVPADTDKSLRELNAPAFEGAGVGTVRTVRSLHAPESEPADVTPILINVSAPPVVAAWIAAMEAHASQTSARNYVKLQLTRAQLHGLRAACEYAIALFPNDPLVMTSLAQLNSSTRSF